jgi:hypothetical protein
MAKWSTNNNFQGRSKAEEICVFSFNHSGGRFWVALGFSFRSPPSQRFFMICIRLMEESLPNNRNLEIAWVSGLREKIDKQWLPKDQWLQICIHQLWETLQRVLPHVTEGVQPTEEPRTSNSENWSGRDYQQVLTLERKLWMKLSSRSHASVFARKVFVLIHCVYHCVLATPGCFRGQLSELMVINILTKKQIMHGVHNSPLHNIKVIQSGNFGPSNTGFLEKIGFCLRGRKGSILITECSMLFAGSSRVPWNSSGYEWCKRMLQTYHYEVISPMRGLLS